jgi:hypothetical protein
MQVGIKEETAVEAPAAVDAKHVFRTTCEAMTAAAVRLPRLEQTFSTAWPAAVRYILPSGEPGAALEQTWPPVLAWIVLRSFPAQGIRAALFDSLQLRSALAEIFSSLGMEGETMWRAAAKVRVLLRQADAGSTFTIQSEAFWDDPDVRWLAGVNTAAGTTYFNREQFEELLCWVQLPALVEIAEHSTSKSHSIGEVEAAISKACRAATEAGYKLDTYLSLLSGERGERAPVKTSEPDASLADATTKS